MIFGISIEEKLHFERIFAENHEFRLAKIFIPENFLEEMFLQPRVRSSARRPAAGWAKTAAVSAELLIIAENIFTDFIS